MALALHVTLSEDPSSSQVVQFNVLWTSVATTGMMPAIISHTSTSTAAIPTAIESPPMETSPISTPLTPVIPSMTHPPLISTPSTPPTKMWAVLHLHLWSHSLSSILHQQLPPYLSCPGVSHLFTKTPSLLLVFTLSRTLAHAVFKTNATGLTWSLN